MPYQCEKRSLVVKWVLYIFSTEIKTTKTEATSCHMENFKTVCEQQAL